jgi:hypothetical protein
MILEKVVCVGGRQPVPLRCTVGSWADLPGRADLGITRFTFTDRRIHWLSPFAPAVCEGQGERVPVVNQIARNVLTGIPSSRGSRSTRMIAIRAEDSDALTPIDMLLFLPLNERCDREVKGIVTI